MGGSKSKSAGGRLQSNDTKAKGKQYFTNCICVGCGCSNDLCRPALAGEFRLCCLESATRMDCSKCDEAHEVCMARCGAKAGPLIVDAKNPLIDNHEFVVVTEKKVLGFSKHKKAGGKLQSRETDASGRHYFTNCICVGCGCSDDLCRPGLAGEARCCCLESATRMDCSKCDEASELCAARCGAKAGPLVVDGKNPLIDNDDLVVFVEKKVYGC